ncbi:RHS repeat protein [Aquimarina brevivitae]|uniref:YD repeat-containing protein n=1 Tax=Aquimarina brevivitae TaxID=323412 RepID=A0A4Q7P1F9_9FLAO|nr:RHS repeat domain-containing protein [Aquimarina brevivitae]RZS93148.1 YD repeat-containing protein [Aquimarina brevivitae]
MISRQILAFLLLAGLTCLAQDNSQNDLSIDYGGELSRIAAAAKSPETAAFQRYGNTDVGLYTGTANVSIPLYQHTGKEFTLPMALTYDGQAIKVEQQATNVGLSWNLNIGGRVSRIVNGMPDDYIFSDYNTIFNTTIRASYLQYRENNFSFDSAQEAIAYFDFLEDVNDNRIDIELDYYSINAPGLNDMVVIDPETLTAKCLKNPRNKVTYLGSGYINKWLVTSENGTQYIFEELELTKTQGNDAGSVGGIVKEYVSSWLLTKIISPLQQDTYEFNYTSTGYWSEPFTSSPVSHVTNQLRENPGGHTISAAKGGSFIPQTWISQKMLTSISYNNNLLVSMLLKNRLDLPLTVASAIDEITIHAPNLANDSPPVLNNPIKRVKLYHSYFGITANENPASKHHMELRLKLDQVEIFGSSNTESKTYSLTYISPQQLPHKNSRAQDYLGYYNGKNNDVLYPSYVKNGDKYTGADRTPDFGYMKIGMLSKITYPTGGHSIFEYEQHRAITGSSATTETREVVYGSLSLTGGEDETNSAVCGSYCIDKYQFPPKINSSVFTIPEGYTYELEYNIEGQNNAAAYLFKHMSDNPSSPAYNADPLPYNQIINQSTGQYSVNMLWSSYGSADKRQIYLAAGNYQLTLVNAMSGYQYVRVYREETFDTSESNGEFLKAGLRIKSIKDYEDNATLASSKVYRYTTSSNGSSGRVIFNPNLAYTVTRTMSDGIDNQIITTLHRLSGSSSNQPHVVYQAVKVIQQSTMPTADDHNGYTFHQFNIGSDGITSFGKRPYTNNFVANYKVGKEAINYVFNKDNDTLATSESYYENPLYYSTVSLSLDHNEDNSTKYIQIYFDESTNQYRYRYLEPLWTGGSLGSTSDVLGPNGTAASPAPMPPPACDDPNSICLQDFSLSTLQLRRNLIQAGAGNLNQTISTQYFEDKKVTTINETDFDPAIDYLPRTTKKVLNTSDSLQTTFYYPKDFSSTAHMAMVDANRLTEVVKVERFQVDSIGGEQTTTLLGQKQTLYRQEGNGLYVPSEIQVGKGASEPESRIVYHKYDSSLNPIEIAQPNGIHSIFIWGYHKQYPVAKITNASYTDMPQDLLDLIAAIQADSDQENTNLEEIALQEKLNTLRAHPYFSNSAVTTYTYDPLIGIKSVTDPRGYTTSYQYDSLGRLQLIKDNDGHLISENKYNYKN